MRQKESFKIHSNSPECKAFRETLQGLLDAAGVKEKTKGEIILAMDEALSNIVRHAYEGEKGGPVEVDFLDFDDRIELAVRDFGKKFDLNQVAPPELPPTRPGGLGVYFIKTLMDKAEHDASFQGGNQLLLTKYK